MSTTRIITIGSAKSDQNQDTKKMATTPTIKKTKKINL